MCIGFMCGSVWLRLQKLDHPTTLGIGDIGCATASGGVHKVKPCSWRLLVGVLQVVAWVMTRGPAPHPEIVGWEMGARTCLHVAPSAQLNSSQPKSAGLPGITRQRVGLPRKIFRLNSLLLLECRFNKTTHHPQSLIQNAPMLDGLAPHIPQRACVRIWEQTCSGST